MLKDIVPGKVYLVGAGPGDPGLLTIRGMECLLAADTVLSDGIANPALPEMYCPHAERIHVGKRKGNCAKTQEEINHLLVEKARQGKTVVRLKGGDPMIFGRGGEEARALSRAGIAFEVVPGVSCVSAVPAYAGSRSRTGSMPPPSRSTARTKEAVSVFPTRNGSGSPAIPGRWFS